MISRRPLTAPYIPFGFGISTAGWIRDLHPLETCAARRTRKRGIGKAGSSSFYAIMLLLNLQAVPNYLAFTAA